jgi:ABC-type nickel/cobalt efflux system permease component RcnA
MRFFLAAGFALIVAIGCAPSASAHPLDVAYFDLAASASSTARLTVAVHPYQAFELVRAGKAVPFDLKKLQAGGGLVAAYVDEHVRIRVGEKECAWEPEDIRISATELEAVGDGVTLAGDIRCPADPSRLTIETDMFLAGFLDQSNVVRYERDSGFSEAATLGKDRRSVDVDLGMLRMSVPAMSVPSGRGDLGVRAIAERLTDRTLSWWEWMVVLAIAAGVGALHALGPGHGKGLMAAVLVGEKATAKHVLALGATMTLTHVADVFLLALLASTAVATFSFGQVLSWLQLASAVGLVLFGGTNIIRAVLRYRTGMGNPSAVADDEAHVRAHALGLPHAHGPAEAASSDSHLHAHDHGDGHFHAHGDPSASFGKALWAGFISSLAPCPTAWAIFMGTLALGRPWAGLALLVAFTVGLQATVLALGFLVVYSRRFLMRRASPRITLSMPVVSAVLICGLGIYLLVTR